MNGKEIIHPLPAVMAADPVERLASLFDAHHDRLYRLARRMAPSPDDALDLVQETFLKAARSPASIPVGATSEEAWLVRVLINVRRDQWRKASVRNHHDKSSPGVNHPSDVGNDPEAVLIAKSAVWQALDVLPPRRRAILIMYELEGLAVPSIAALLGITAITVRWHLSMGRRDLTAALKSYREDINEKH